MTDLRKAAEVALEALEKLTDKRIFTADLAGHYGAVISSLRQALAQGEPQVCCGDYEKCMDACTPRGRWLAEKELAKPEQPMTPEYLPQYIATNNVRPMEGGGGGGAPASVEG